jgi:hypothetical protein
MTEMSLSSTTPRTAPAATSAAVRVAAFVAAAAFVVEGVISVVHPTGDRHWDLLSQALNAAYLIACLALMVALPAVGSWLGAGRVGRVGVVAAQVGYAAMAGESIVSAVDDGNTLGGLFLIGLLLTLAGLLVLAVAGLVSGVRRWASALPLLGMLIGIAGGDLGGSIVLGAVWALLGVALIRSEY